MNNIFVRVLKHFTTKNDGLKRPLPVIGAKQNDFYKPRQKELPPKSSQMNARSYRLENNVAAEFDVRQRIYLHEFSIESAHEAQIEVLTHEAAEELHRRDCPSLGMIRTLEIESHSNVAVQRERFEQTRDYHQRSLHASNKEYNKQYNLFEEYQDERSSMIPGVRPLQDRERLLTSEVSQAQYRETDTHTVTYRVSKAKLRNRSRKFQIRNKIWKKSA